MSDATIGGGGGGAGYWWSDGPYVLGHRPDGSVLVPLPEGRLLMVVMPLREGPNLVPRKTARTAYP